MEDVAASEDTSSPVVTTVSEATQDDNTTPPHLEALASVAESAATVVSNVVTSVIDNTAHQDVVSSVPTQQVSVSSVGAAITVMPMEPVERVSSPREPTTSAEQPISQSTYVVTSQVGIASSEAEVREVSALFSTDSSSFPLTQQQLLLSSATRGGGAIRADSSESLRKSPVSAAQDMVAEQEVEEGVESEEGMEEDEVEPEERMEEEEVEEVVAGGREDPTMEIADTTQGEGI